MQKSQAIILVGYARSGKDTAANFLCKGLGFKKLVFSDFIGLELRKAGMVVSKNNLSWMGDVLRKKHGMDVVARLLWKQLKKKKWKKIVLVGARSLKEISYLRKRIKGLKIVEIRARADLRFKRRPSKKMSKKEFSKRDKIDAKNKGLDKVIALAQFTVINEGKLPDFKQKLRELMYKVYK